MVDKHHSVIYNVKNYTKLPELPNPLKKERNMIALQGKKAIVTGGAMGIGLATCRRLIKEGCEVTIWDLSEKDLDAAAKELKEAGGIVFPYRCDVADKNRVHELAVQARKDMGRVDILINNAGYVRHGMFWEQPVENAVKQMDVNVNALFCERFFRGRRNKRSGPGCLHDVQMGGMGAYRCVAAGNDDRRKEWRQIHIRPSGQYSHRHV